MQHGTLAKLASLTKKSGFAGLRCSLFGSNFGESVTERDQVRMVKTIRKKAKFSTNWGLSIPKKVHLRRSEKVF